MELKDTVELMLSNDWKDRLKAEYWQTKIRYNKLVGMIERYKAGALGFKPNCSLALLERQTKHMSLYLEILRTRADIENVEGINIKLAVSYDG